jgi:hypothetical protein
VHFGHVCRLGTRCCGAWALAPPVATETVGTGISHRILSVPDVLFGANHHTRVPSAEPARRSATILKTCVKIVALRCCLYPGSLFFSYSKASLAPIVVLRRKKEFRAVRVNLRGYRKRYANNVPELMKLEFRYEAEYRTWVT